MAKRAFIIAIENYAQMEESLGVTLANTHKHAVEFRRWLIDVQKVADSDIFFCTEDPTVQGRTGDATRLAVKNALELFKNQFKDTTDDLYFYFSGHGLCYVDVDDVPMADVLICSDYVKRGSSGEACLKLDEIQKWLKMCLGSETTVESPHCGHYYFIDACRNKATERQIKVAPLGLTYEMSSKKKAPIFTLYSTTMGALANVGSGFHDALLEGLNGKGKAKRWYEGTLAILFDSLRGYIERRLDTDLEPRVEGGDGLIRKFPPGLLEYSCTVSVANGDEQDEFQVEVKNINGLRVQGFEFKGPVRSFNLPVDDYLVQVSLKCVAYWMEGVVYPEDPLPADLYDNCTLKFRKGAFYKSGPLGGDKPETMLRVVAPADAEIILRGAKKELRGKGSIQAPVAPGQYDLETRDPRGVTVDRRRVTVESRESREGVELLEIMKENGPEYNYFDVTEIDLTKLRQSPLRDSLLKAIPDSLSGEDGTVQFSESVGPMLDQGLDLWLALIGAARIVGEQNEFTKLGPLPLESFYDVSEKESSFYMLAGFDEPETKLRAVVAEDWQAIPAPIEPHSMFPGLFEFAVKPSAPGSFYVTVQIDSNASTTFPICLLPMRCTLVTLSRSHTEGLHIQQFILPLKKFRNQLPRRGLTAGLWLEDESVFPEEEQENVKTPLRIVRRCVEVQRAFARAQELEQALTATELQFLLFLKWFEPIIALMSAYELIRRGQQESLPVVVYNLRKFFHGLPDTEALAKLASGDWEMPSVPPLLLEGFQALNLMAQRPGGVPPGDALVFRGPWTMWRGLATP